MVFVTLQASVFHSFALDMEEWPRVILSAQSANVVMLVPSDFFFFFFCLMRFETLKNGKCVRQTLEREKGLNVISRVGEAGRGGGSYC